MATSFGLLNSFDNDYQYVNTVGTGVVYDAIVKILADYNAEQAEMLRVFVGRRTANHQERFYAPIGGEMQTMGRQAEAGAVKRSGSWDVAYPLTQIGDQLAGDRVDTGYMTAGQLEAHLMSIMTRDANSVRRDMLAAIFYNQARAFLDFEWGNLAIQPLANGDATIYPQVIGAVAGAVDNHYLTAAALNAAAMNAAYGDLIEHFGQKQSGDNVICFANSANIATIAALAGYTADIDRYLGPVSVAISGLRTIPYAPGITVGRWNSVWVNSWDWIPANYMVFIHLDYPGPLSMREDPAGTGLGTGLQLVSTDEEHPIWKKHFEHRYGFGVTDRLNGVVLQITAGAYAVPAIYNFFRYCAA